MIVGLTGIITKKNPPVLWLQTSGGITYELLMPIPCFAKLTENQTLNQTEKQVEVFIHCHLIVREDAHSLYGFSNQESCNLFKMLIKINGVGAKTALAILSSFSMTQFKAIAVNKDTKAMTKVPGIGTKTAERMMVDIADFIKKLDTELGIAFTQDSQNLYQAKQALIALGFKETEADKLTKGLEPSLAVSDLVKLALAKK